MKYLLMAIALVVGCFITSSEPASAKERDSRLSETVQPLSQQIEQKEGQTAAAAAGPFGQFTTQVAPLIGEQPPSKTQKKRRRK